MKYEYNGNLNSEDRIKAICNDIKNEYPEIPLEKLKKIAALEEPIIDKTNLIIKFKRLYNILIIINNDEKLSETYNKVMNDIANIYNMMSNEEKLTVSTILYNILEFKNNSGMVFPIN